MHLDTSTGIHIHESVPLAGKTTLCVGGPARFYMVAHTVEAVSEGLRWSHDHDQPLLVLGGGSNLVIGDEGWPGLVMRLDLRGIAFEERDATVRMRVGAGESWDDFVMMTVERGLAGLECLSGIPGLVGATPIQNVGAYGQEVSEAIQTVEAIDRTSGKRVTFSNEDCGFGYRTSRFKKEDRDRYVIVSVVYEMERDATPMVRYAELERELESRGLENPTPGDVRDTVIAIRRLKGMVIDPDDPDSRSVGSFFTNPILNETGMLALRARAGEIGAIPAYPAGEGLTKVSAAWLIEQAGFSKGLVRGKVGISTKHSLAIVNVGGGTADEVRHFAEQIRSGVREKFGVQLEVEPRVL